MDEFMIHYNKIKNTQQVFDEYSSSLNTYINELDSIKRNLRSKIVAHEQIGKRLQVLSDATESCSGIMTLMSEKIYSIGKKYETTEQKITGYGEPQAVAEEAVNQGNDWLWKIVGKAGPVGAVADAINSTVQRGDGQKSAEWYDYLKDASKVGKSVANAAGKFGNPDWAKYLFGFNQSSMAGKGFAENLKDAVKGEVVGGSNIVAKWFSGIGFAAKVVGRAADNFKDYQDGEMGFERAVAETVGEVAVDVVWSGAVSAIVGTGLTAVAGTIGLPFVGSAVVVGVATVGVKWLADTVSKSLFGKDVVEAASDFVLDSVEKVGNAVKNTGKAICEWGSNLFKKITG